MTRLFFALVALALGAHSVIAQQDTTRRPQTRADSARLKAIQDSIALMRAIEGAQAPTTRPAQGGASGPTNARLLPDISSVGDLIADLSPKGTTQEDGARMSVREVELAIQAVVDPYFRGDIFLGVSDLESISIEQAGSGGTLTLKSAGNVTVEASAPGNLTLRGGKGVKIDAGAGMVELSGSQVKLN